MMNRKFAAVLMVLLLVAINIFAFEITGDISNWQKEDFIGFDEVGDCTASCGDITSVFSRIENEILFIRITFDDMVQRTQNRVVKDNFLNKDIYTRISLFAGKEKKVIFQKTFPLQPLIQKDGDEKILRTASYNMAECSLPFVSNFSKEQLIYKVDIFLGDVIADNFIGKGNTLSWEREPGTNVTVVTIRTSRWDEKPI